MRIWKKSFIAKIILTGFLGICCFTWKSTDASSLGTLNDLRELAGEKRLEDKTLIQEIRQIIANYEKGKEWNELVDLLKEMDGEAAYEKWQEKERARIEIINKMDRDFISNEPIETLLAGYSDYLTAEKERMDYFGIKSPVIDYAKDMEEAYQYAKSIMEAMEDSFVFGVLGKEMETFTGKNLILYDLPKSTDAGIVVQVDKDSPINSQFNGTVTEVSGTEVTITSGKSVITQYAGIKPMVKKGETVSQYQQIGKAEDELVEFAITINTIPTSPLRLYGTRGIHWYLIWVETAPGKKAEIPDFFRVQDEIQKQEEPKKQQSTVVSEGDETREINLEGKPYSLEDEKIITKEETYEEETNQ